MVQLFALLGRIRSPYQRAIVALFGLAFVNALITAAASLLLPTYVQLLFEKFLESAETRLPRFFAHPWVVVAVTAGRSLFVWVGDKQVVVVRWVVLHEYTISVALVLGTGALLRMVAAYTNARERLASLLSDDDGRDVLVANRRLRALKTGMQFMDYARRAPALEMRTASRPAEPPALRVCHSRAPVPAPPPPLRHRRPAPDDDEVCEAAQDDGEDPERHRAGRRPPRPSLAPSRRAAAPLRGGRPPRRRRPHGGHGGGGGGRGGRCWRGGRVPL